MSFGNYFLTGRLPMIDKRPILFFSPLPPVRSGIAGYTNAVCQELVRRGYPVTCVVDEDPGKDMGFSVLNWRDLLYRKNLEEFLESHIIFYQIGNHPCHHFIYPFYFRFPGVLVLHDAVLIHGRADYFMTITGMDAFQEELAYETNQKVAENFRILFKEGFGLSTFFYTIPLHRTVLERTNSIAVHNPVVATMIREKYPEKNVAYIPLGVWRKNIICEDRQNEISQAYTMEREKCFVLGLFGFLNENKEVRKVFQIVRELLHMHYPVKLIIAGYETKALPIRHLATQYGLMDHVECALNASHHEYETFLSRASFCFAYRFPPAGEASLSLLEMMARKRVVFTNTHRYDAYLPDHALVCVPSRSIVGESIRKLTEFFASPEKVHIWQENARSYVLGHHLLQHTVDAYEDIIQTWTGIKSQDREFYSQEKPSYFRPLFDRIQERIRASAPSEQYFHALTSVFTHSSGK